MDLELTGKVAIVGGASKGLGRACAEVLAQEGASVVLCSRSEADLEKTAKEIRGATGRDVLAFAGDLDRLETIQGLIAATVERFGRLDVLVNNSGGPPLALDFPLDASAVEIASLGPAAHTAPGAAASLPPSPAGPGADGPGPAPTGAEAAPQLAGSAPAPRETPADSKVAVLAEAPPKPSLRSPSEAFASNPPAQAGEAPFPPPPHVPAGPRWLDESAAPAGPGRFNIAVAAFGEQEAAQRFARRLDQEGFGPLRVSPGAGGAAGTYRVVMLGLRTRQTAERAARDVRRISSAPEGAPDPGGPATPSPEVSGPPASRAQAPQAAGAVAAPSPVHAKFPETPAAPTGPAGAPAPSPAAAAPPDPVPGPGASSVPAAPTRGGPQDTQPNLGGAPESLAGRAPAAPPPPRDEVAPPLMGPGTTAATSLEPAGGPPAAAAAGRRGFDIAVATFAGIDEARRPAAFLEARGFGPVQLMRRGSAYRLVLTGFSTPETADRAARDARRELASLPDVPLPTGPDQRGAGTPAAPAAGRFALQVASFQDLPRALALAHRLEAQHLGTVILVPVAVGSEEWHRVVLTGFPTREGARRIARALEARFALSPVLVDWAAEGRPAKP